MHIQRIITLALVGLMALALGAGPGLAGSNAVGVPISQAADGVSALLGPGFTYQGQLKDSGGNPITAACDFEFRLWNALSGGAQMGSPSTATNVPVTQGYFSALVNAGSEFGPNAFNGQARWLAVAVACPTGTPSFTALDPRQALTAAPYAISASLLGGHQAGDFALAGHDHWGAAWTGTGTGLSLSGGAIGLLGKGSTYGVAGQTDSTTGAGLYGTSSAASGSTYGVYGVSSSAAGTGVYGSGWIAAEGETSGWLGVFGRNTGTTNSVHIGVAGETYGSDVNNRYHVAVQGYATNPAGGIGVRGLTAGSGIAVLGEANGTTPTSYGVEGITNSGAGTGVFGLAAAASGGAIGVYGRSSSSSGAAGYFSNTAGSGTARGWGVRAFTGSGSASDVHPAGSFSNAAGEFAGPTGVIGAASSDSSTGVGVVGIGAGTGGLGVYGYAPAASGFSYGVYSRSDSTTGTGVLGWASATSGATNGVTGLANSTSGVAGYFVNSSGSGVWSRGFGVRAFTGSGSASYVHPSGSFANAAGEFSGPTGVIGSASDDSTFGYGVIGTSAGTGGTGVFGWTSATSGFTYGVYGRSDAPAGSGVYGLATNTGGVNYGVYGRVTSTAGRGVYGLASAGSGSGYGVFGESSSPTGTGVYGSGWIAVEGENAGWLGVYGKNTGTDSSTHIGVAGETYGSDVDHRYHIAVQGYAVNAAGGIGVRGLTAGSGIAVLGESNGATNSSYGVEGTSISVAGRGVYGLNTATTGPAYGVYGETNSANGEAVKGLTNATTGSAVGVYGQSHSSNGSGVHGDDISSYGMTYGVIGVVLSTDGYGVLGAASSSTGNYGVYSVGNFAATGTKAAVVPASAPGVEGTGWVHLYSMESPEVWFEDIGAGKLENGQAVVGLDPLFASTIDVNEPYHIFLTPKGECSLYLADETPTAFTVKALGDPACSIAFDYRIVAKRLGYEGTRLAPAEDPARVMQNARGPESLPVDNPQP